MRDSIGIESDAFEHRTVQPHFINPCCFGEDLAGWLKKQLEPLLAQGFVVSDPIQEDYGWGLWVNAGSDPFWVALSYCGDGPTETPGEWVVTVEYEPGLNVVKRLLQPGAQNFDTLRDHIWAALTAHPRIKLVPLVDGEVRANDDHGPAVEAARMPQACVRCGGPLARSGDCFPCATSVSAGVLWFAILGIVGTIAMLIWTKMATR